MLDQPGIIDFVRRRNVVGHENDRRQLVYALADECVRCSS
jgi:hypothetical protein